METIDEIMVKNGIAVENISKMSPMLYSKIKQSMEDYAIAFHKYYEYGEE